jgi:hypothetical protein
MKLIERHRPGDIAAWVFSIGNQKVPKWACNVASEAIQSLHKQAPDAKVQEFFRVHANGAHFQPVPWWASTLGCILFLKNGQRIEVDLSASCVKHPLTP